MVPCSSCADIWKDRTLPFHNWDASFSRRARGWDLSYDIALYLVRLTHTWTNRMLRPLHPWGEWDSLGISQHNIANIIDADANWVCARHWIILAFGLGDILITHVSRQRYRVFCDLQRALSKGHMRFDFKGGHKKPRRSQGSMILSNLWSKGVQIFMVV